MSYNPGDDNEFGPTIAPPAQPKGTAVCADIDCSVEYPTGKPKESAGREWTGVSIIEWHDSKEVERQDFFGRGDKVHVIEHSAYLAVCRERDELLLNIEQSEPQFKTLIRERDEANEAAAGSALLVQSSRKRLTSALAAIGHLRSAARNLITAWCDGEDIVTAVGALEFALSISEFAEDLRQKYQALLPPSSD